MALANETSENRVPRVVSGGTGASNFPKTIADVMKVQLARTVRNGGIGIEFVRENGEITTAEHAGTSEIK